MELRPVTLGNECRDLIADGKFLHVVNVSATREPFSFSPPRAVARHSG